MFGKITKDSIPGILALSIVGSLLWNVLSPLFEKISQATGVFGNLYIDYIYSKIPHESYDRQIINLCSFVLCLGFGLFSSLINENFKLLKQLLNKQNELTGIKQSEDVSINQEITKTKRKLKTTRFIRIVLPFLFIMLCIDNIMAPLYIIDIQANTFSNIEIVSPYITDSEYKMLKSKFYSIDSKQSYDILTDSLNSISDNYNVSLKE